MSVRDGRKLNKEQVAAMGPIGRGTAALADYYAVWNELEVGEGQTYETSGKGLTERSRWASVAKATGHSFQFSSKKIGPRGSEGSEITCTVIKGPAAAQIHGASVHTIRHTFGTHHAKAGTPLPQIRDMMGHANISTTSIYVATAKTEQNRSLQQNAL